MVLEVRKSRGHKAGEDQAAVRLKKGRNEVKVKVAQGVQGWEFSVMITAPDGKPVEGVRSVAPLGVK
jgi:hypothetical protein